MKKADSVWVIVNPDEIYNRDLYDSCEPTAFRGTVIDAGDFTNCKSGDVIYYRGCIFSKDGDVHFIENMDVIGFEIQ